MNYQKEICEKAEELLRANDTLREGGADVFVEDKGDASAAVQIALGKLGVLVLIATTGHRREKGNGSSTAGDIALELTVFENPKLNRLDRSDALTVTGAAEEVAKALHWQTVTFSDATTARIVYVDMARADADEEDARMVVSFTVFKALDPAHAVTWGAGADATVGEVRSKTVKRGGTNVYEPGRTGNATFVGTRDRHWKIALTCTVAATLAESDLPQLGETFTYGGRTYVTDEASLQSNGEDTSTVTLTGRTINP